MNWFTGIVLYILIWWIALFAVLPIGTHRWSDPTRSPAGAARRSGRGCWMKVDRDDARRGRDLACGASLLIESDWISFRARLFRGAERLTDRCRRSGPKRYNRLCQARERSSSAWRAVAVSSPNLALVRAKPGRHCVNQMQSICHYVSSVFRQNWLIISEFSCACTIISSRVARDS